MLPLLHEYVLPAPPVAVSVAPEPLQMVSVAGVIVGVKLPTVTTALAVEEQFVPFETVTVYVVVKVGLTVITAESLPLLQA